MEKGLTIKGQKERKLRLSALQRLLETKGLEALIVVNPLHLFYLTGSFFTGLLLITPKEIQIFVKRPQEVVNSLSTLSARLFNHYKDLLPLFEGFNKVHLDRVGVRYEEIARLQRIFPRVDLEGGLLWELRLVKSPYEVSLLEGAAKNLNQAIKEWIPLLRVGLTELEASALLEEKLRRKGHPGYTRSNLGFELAYGYLISGKEGLKATHFQTGEGGVGVPGFPGGASFKRLKKREPILFDFSGYHHGYYVDQARMLSFGRVKAAEEFFWISEELLKTFERKVKAGITAEEVWALAVEFVGKRGLLSYFMNHGGRMKFVGHGVGLQIDEPPTLAEGQKIKLTEGMVVALEPKFHVPELGVIGLEDTFLVKRDGLKRITTFPREWIFLNSTS